MIEKHIVLEDVDLLTFYGVNNIHLQMLKALYCASWLAATASRCWATSRKCALSRKTSRKCASTA